MLHTLFEFRKVIVAVRVRVVWDTGWERNSSQFTRELAQLRVGSRTVEYLDRFIVVIVILLFVLGHLALEAL